MRKLGRHTTSIAILTALIGGFVAASGEARAEDPVIMSAKMAARCLGETTETCNKFRLSMNYLANFPNPSRSAIGGAFLWQERRLEQVKRLSEKDREFDFAMRYLALFPNQAQAAVGKAYIATVDK